MNEETSLQEIYREKALGYIKALSFALDVAEQDNLNDIITHMVAIEHMTNNLNRELSALNVLKCHHL